MKKIIVLMIVATFSITMLSAQETLREVVNDYQNNNSEFTLVIPSFLVKMGVRFGDLEDEEREVLENIDNMKIVISENNFEKSDFSLLERGIKNGTFSELMTIHEEDETIRMILNKKSESKSELLMLVEGENESVIMLIDFHGEPDFKNFVSLVD